MSIRYREHINRLKDRYANYKNSANYVPTLNGHIEKLDEGNNLGYKEWLKSLIQFFKETTKELFMFLQENLNSSAATANAMELEKIAVANMAKVSREILFEVAMKPINTLNARIAFDSLVGSGIVDFKRLRSSEVDSIALKAYFYDPSSTKEEIAQALVRLLPKSDKVQVGTTTKKEWGYEVSGPYNFPIEVESEVPVYEDRYSDADIQTAVSLMHQLTEAQRSDVYFELAALDEAFANRLLPHLGLN